MCRNSLTPCHLGEFLPLLQIEVPLMHRIGASYIPLLTVILHISCRSPCHRLGLDSALHSFKGQYASC